MLGHEIERTFDRCREALEDLRFTDTRRWKRDHPGKKAVGFFPVYVPQEIIHAAGFLPIGLAGAGDRLDIQHADARFGSFICSIVKTTLEMGMTDHLDCFDALLFSSICDSARNLCWVMKRNFPDKYIDFLHLPHNPSSPASVEFLASEYRRLIAHLNGIGGEYTDDKLRVSLELFDRQRALVRDLYALRRESPHLLRAWECYVLIRAGNVLPVEEHIPMLEQVLTHAPARDLKKRDSLRVVVEGSFCEQPPIEVIKLIEAAGCEIVEDDFALAQRWFTGDVYSGESDPVLAMADAYINRSVYSSVRHDFRKPRWEGLADKIKLTRADAVLFLMAKFCEPAYFDYVPYKQTVEEMGIPHLSIEFEEKLFTFERLRTEVETFVESLVFD
jgi:benzoyl-CoA reductase subunit C